MPRDWETPNEILSSALRHRKKLMKDAEMERENKHKRQEEFIKKVQVGLSMAIIILLVGVAAIIAIFGPLIYKYVEFWFNSATVTVKDCEVKPVKQSQEVLVFNEQKFVITKKEFMCPAD